MAMTQRVELAVVTFLHCRTCVTRREPEQLQIGLSPSGLLIWCKACDQQVAHFKPDELMHQLSRQNSGVCLCEPCKARARANERGVAH